MKILIKTLSIFASLFVLTTLNAQPNDRNPFELGFQFQSSKTWRGLNISDEPFIQSKLSITNKQKTLALGVRGSNSFNGDYKQFDYFASYKLGKFNFSVWDIYNYSAYLKPDPDIFDYSPETTRHFIDATIAYQVSNKFPLNISWSTIVFGRDRDVLPEDALAKSDKDPVRNGKNRYSTYVQLAYPFKYDGFIIKPYIGGVFALNSKNTFYSDNAGIATIGFNTYSKMKIGNLNLPISVNPYWNIQKNTGGVDLIVKLH